MFSGTLHRMVGTYSVSQSSRSVVSDSAIPWTTAHQASLSITNSRLILFSWIRNYIF